MTRMLESVPDWLNVSRETAERLSALCRLVEKWNPAINLVSKVGILGLWQRHILDSAQLFELAPTGAARWCDIGSGGGFPGLVIAILAKETRPDLLVTLVEIDRRKSVFLMQAARQLGLSVAIKTERIEELTPVDADVLSARAVAPLAELCRFAARHLRSDGVALFPKGVGAPQEITDARKLWDFQVTSVESRTDSQATVLLLRDIRHA